MREAKGQAGKGVGFTLLQVHGGVRHLLQGC